MATQQNKANAPVKKNRLEWAVFGCSLILLLLIIGYLVYQSFSHQTTPPELTITYTRESSKRHPFRYKVTVTNAGGETAEDLVIEATLTANGSIIEQSELQFPFVPRASHREGWVNFSTLPPCDTCISIKVAGFRKP